MTQLGAIPFPPYPTAGQLFEWADRAWVWDEVAWRDASNDLSPLAEVYIRKSGDAMTGPLLLADDPTESKGAATKQYVDNMLSPLSRAINDVLARVAALEP